MYEVEETSKWLMGRKDSVQYVASLRRVSEETETNFLVV